MIRERLVSFLARLSDTVFQGRNRARIVIGTDRKDTRQSGYGDEGENDPESASIDIVAGYVSDSGDISFVEDKSRIYLSGKTNPDEYSGIDKGENVEGEAAIIGISDHVYLKARKKTKIVGSDYNIIMEDGNITIEATGADAKIELKLGSQIVRINNSGIELDAGQGLSGKILTDNDLCVGIDPTTGGPIISNFKNIAQGALVNNQKIIIK